MFEFNLTRYPLKIDSVVFCSDLKPVVVHRSRLRRGVDSLMHKVIEVTEEALRSMRAPDEYLPETVAEIFDVVRSLLASLINNRTDEVSVTVDIKYYLDDDQVPARTGINLLDFGST